MDVDRGQEPRQLSRSRAAAERRFARWAASLPGRRKACGDVRGIGTRRGRSQQIDASRCGHWRRVHRTRPAFPAVGFLCFRQLVGLLPIVVSRFGAIVVNGESWVRLRLEVVRPFSREQFVQAVGLAIIAALVRFILLAIAVPGVVLWLRGGFSLTGSAFWWAVVVIAWLPLFLAIGLANLPSFEANFWAILWLVAYCIFLIVCATKYRRNQALSAWPLVRDPARRRRSQPARGLSHVAESGCGGRGESPSAPARCSPVPTSRRLYAGGLKRSAEPL